MTAVRALLVVGVVCIATVSLRAERVSPVRGVEDVRQAQLDYVLKCQGCHRPDGSGDAFSNPPMNGIVASFLRVDGGRAYLGRVPGVATVDLDDKRLAQLLNWTLYRFDGANMPADFRPYSAGEIAKLRKAPLRFGSSQVRKDLIAKLGGRQPGDI